MQVVEMFREIVARTQAVVLPQLQAYDPKIQQLHYEHGHYAEITNTLASMENAASFFGKKYPLIALFEDVTETVSKGIGEARMTIVICYNTSKDDRAGDRYTKVINPILDPIYQELINQIKHSGYFMDYTVRHTKINRPYWGVEGKYGNRGNILGDILDAIELQNVRLKIYPQYNC